MLLREIEDIHCWIHCSYLQYISSLCDLCLLLLFHPFVLFLMVT